METPGIYRTSGRAGQCDKIMKKVAGLLYRFLSSFYFSLQIEDIRNPSGGDALSEKELDNIEINTLCSMVKSYIKYLRVPMATYDLYDDFISAGS